MRGWLDSKCCCNWLLPIETKSLSQAVGQADFKFGPGRFRGVDNLRSLARLSLTPPKKDQAFSILYFAFCRVSIFHGKRRIADDPDKIIRRPLSAKAPSIFHK
jgi:hypothetical protein